MNTINLNFIQPSLLSTFLQLEEIPYDDNGWLLPQVDIKDNTVGRYEILSMPEQNDSTKYILAYTMSYSIMASNLETKKFNFVFQCKFVGQFDLLGITSSKEYEDFINNTLYSDDLLDNLAPRLLFGEVRRYALDTLFKSGIRNINIPEPSFVREDKS